MNKRKYIISFMLTLCLTLTGCNINSNEISSKNPSDASNEFSSEDAVSNSSSILSNASDHSDTSSDSSTVSSKKEESNMSDGMIYGINGVDVPDLRNVTPEPVEDMTNAEILKVLESKLEISFPKSFTIKPGCEIEYGFDKMPGDGLIDRYLSYRRFQGTFKYDDLEAFLSTFKKPTWRNDQNIFHMSYPYMREFITDENNFLYYQRNLHSYYNNMYNNAILIIPDKENNTCTLYLEGLADSGVNKKGVIYTK